MDANVVGPDEATKMAELSLSNGIRLNRKVRSFEFLQLSIVAFSLLSPIWKALADWLLLQSPLTSSQSVNATWAAVLAGLTLLIDQLSKPLKTRAASYLHYYDAHISKTDVTPEPLGLESVREELQLNIDSDWTDSMTTEAKEWYPPELNTVSSSTLKYIGLAYSNALFDEYVLHKYNDVIRRVAIWIIPLYCISIIIDVDYLYARDVTRFFYFLLPLIVWLVRYSMRYRSQASTLKSIKSQCKEVTLQTLATDFANIKQMLSNMRKDQVFVLQQFYKDKKDDANEYMKRHLTDYVHNNQAFVSSRMNHITTHG